jgi:serine/threonine protein kinase
LKEKLNAYKCLPSHSYHHRDIKSKNIVIDFEKKKFGDFTNPIPSIGKQGPYSIHSSPSILDENAVRVQEPMLPMLDNYKTQHPTAHALLQAQVTFLLPSFRLIDNSQRSIHDQAVHPFLQELSILPCS